MTADAQSRINLLARYKSRLVAGQASLREAYLADSEPLSLLQGRSALTDAVIADLWDELGIPTALTMVAVGGYGRGELYPASDVDLLVLLSTEPDATLTYQLEQLISLLWDIGLEIGHSVRTIEECVEEAAADLTVRTAFEGYHLPNNRIDYPFEVEMEANV